MKFHTKYVHEDNATLSLAKYANGDTAIKVAGVVATVNLEEYGIRPGKGNVIIKDYSENEGVLKALQDGGVVGPIIYTHPHGWVESYECRLL